MSKLFAIVQKGGGGCVKFIKCYKGEGMYKILGTSALYIDLKFSNPRDEYPS